MELYKACRESNYLLKRKNFIVKKSLFKEFYSKYNKELKEGNLKKILYLFII